MKRICLWKHSKMDLKIEVTTEDKTCDTSWNAALLEEKRLQPISQRGMSGTLICQKREPGVLMGHSLQNLGHTQ